MRRLLRAKSYTVMLLATLSVGLALSIAMFAIVWGVAFAPLPYPDSENIVTLNAERSESRARGGLTPREAIVELPSVDALQDVAYYQWGGVDWIDNGETVVFTINSVAPSFFDVLRSPPLLGRTLTGDDAGQQRLVLSHFAWQRMTGGDPTIVGKTLKTGWIDAEVVGVMPPTFAFPDKEVALWIVADETNMRSDPVLFDNARYLNAIGRLAPGATPTALDTQLGQLRPRRGDDWTLRGQVLLDAEVGARRPLLLALLAIAALVLIVGCANAAHLVFVRGHERARSLTVMQALGASPTRAALEFFGETAAISALALLVALVLARIALNAVGIADSGLPRIENIAISPLVVGFAAGSTVLAMLLAGLLPAWRLRGSAQRTLARQLDAPAMGWLERAMPAVAIALSLAAVATAAALALSAERMARQPQLANVDQVLALQLWRNGNAPETDEAFFADALRALQATPGALRSALMSGAPFSQVGSLRLDVHERSSPDRQHSIQTRAVAGPAMEMLGGRILRGRALSDDDRKGAPLVAVINERAAFEIFGSRDPMGQVVLVPPYGSGDPQPFEIVGLMEDLTSDRVDFKRPSAELWLSFAQYPVPFGAFLVESQAAPMALARVAEAAIKSADPGQAIYASFAPKDLIAQQLALPRFFARNAGAFALLALGLAVIGIYGVLAVDLARRRQELALRAALGADGRALITRVAQQGALIGLPGLALGAVLASFAIAAMERVLIGVDGQTLLLVAVAATPLLLLLVGVSLSLGRQAARVDPALTLRA
jgi:predicted permease